MGEMPSIVHGMILSSANYRRDTEAAHKRTTGRHCICLSNKETWLFYRLQQVWGKENIDR